ncbi:MAG: hypothetical protein KDK23_05160 [Leptospiraceae bacterium]|nr:hypothetical protein [Leptospiraceae bacterium]
MKRISIFLSIFVIASLAYCKGGSGPVGAVESLQDAACDGNFEEFRKHMDMDAIVDRSVDYMMKSRGMQDNAQLKAMIDAQKPQMKEQMVAQMEKSLAQSKGGPDCDSSVELISEEGNTAKVSITGSGEEKKTLELEKGEDGKWRVVFFDDIAKAMDR